MRANQQRGMMAAKLGLKDNTGFNKTRRCSRGPAAVVQQTAARFLDGKKFEDGKFGTAGRRWPRSDRARPVRQGVVNRIVGHFLWPQPDAEPARR